MLHTIKYYMMMENEYFNEYINGTSQRIILTNHKVRKHNVLNLYSCILILRLNTV